jgi:hypothetical protein
MILHDFRCEACGLVSEHLIESNVTVIQCSECHGNATRVFKQLAKPHWLALAQGDSASPEAIDRFERMHKQQKAKEDKSWDEHGDYGPRPGAD